MLAGAERIRVSPSSPATARGRSQRSKGAGGTAAAGRGASAAAPGPSGAPDGGPCSPPGGGGGNHGGSLLLLLSPLWTKADSCGRLRTPDRQTACSCGFQLLSTGGLACRFLPPSPRPGVERDGCAPCGHLRTGQDARGHEGLDGLLDLLSLEEGLAGDRPEGELDLAAVGLRLGLGEQDREEREDDTACDLRPRLDLLVEVPVDVQSKPRHGPPPRGLGVGNGGTGPLAPYALGDQGELARVAGVGGPGT